MKIKVSKSLVAQVANTEEGAETEGIFCFCFVFCFLPQIFTYSYRLRDLTTLQPLESAEELNANVKENLLSRL